MKVPGVVAAAAHTLEVGQGKVASSSDAPPPPVGLRRLWLLVLVQLFPFALGVVALPALLLDACGGSEHEAATYVTLGNSLFFGLQWACAGAWGGFSDRAGRRPLLLVGVASDALGAAPAPENLTASDFLFFAGPLGNSSGLTGKYDVGTSGPINLDFIGESWEYPAANYSRRLAIRDAHAEYTLGLLHFLARFQ